MSDFIPSREADQVLWFNNLFTSAVANASVLGLSSSQISELTTLVSSFSNSLDSVETAKSNFRQAALNKENAQKALSSKIREFNKTWRTRPQVTDSVLTSLGLPIYSSQRTPSTSFTVNNLVAEPTSNGLISVKFDRNNNSSRAIFQIQTSTSPNGPWTIFGTTNKVRTTLSGINPGTETYIRVVTDVAGRMSNPTNSVVVYPQFSTNTTTLKFAA